MIKQFNNFIENLIKPEYDLVLENLLSDLQKNIFTLYYVKKVSKIDIQKELKISKYKLDKNLENIREKIYKIKAFNFKFSCDDTTEKRLIERCKRLGKSEDYIQFCILAFIKKLKKREIADIMCIDIETVRKYKSQRRKELECF